MKDTHDATGESAATASDAGRANVTQDASGTAVWLVPDPNATVLMVPTEEVEHEGHDDDR